MAKDASSLEIHFINVSQGDSILIINRDIVKLKDAIETARLPVPTDSVDYLPLAIENSLALESTIRKAVLIDGGEDYYGGAVFDYVQQYGIKGDATRQNFATVVSHYHSDHTDGVRCVYRRREGKQIVTNYPPAAAYDMGDDPSLDPDTLTYCNYVDDLNEFMSHNPRLTTRIKLAPNDFIDLGQDSNNTPMRLRCLAANGVVFQAGGHNINIIDTAKSIDQNDRSVVLALEYGDFRCLFGGDAGGNGRADGGNLGNNADQRSTQYWSSHGDLEKPLRKAVTDAYPADAQRANTRAGHMCCFKSHHHGSASSNDVYFLGAMLPTLILCSSGTYVKFHGHPTQEALNRMDGTVSAQWPIPNSTALLNNSIDGYYITEMAKDGPYSWGGQKKQQYTRQFPRGKILGDIIVRPFGKVVPENATGANTIKIQVYGTGDQAAVNESKPIRDIDSSKMADAPYRVGPWEHTCDKH